MIEKDEVVLKRGSEWLRFSQPYRVVTTENLHEVHEALQEVEGLVESNRWHAAGFISYEAAPAFDTALHIRNSREFPLLWFGLYPIPQVISLPLVGKKLPRLKWQPSIEKKAYFSAVEEIKDYIARGMTYQVNFTMRLNSAFTGSAWELFLNLAQNQNKYAAYINIGRYAICSASPELFFQLDGETITSRPMKGTARRGRTTVEDDTQAEWLQSSIKNRAENVMIVDMIRNDLGRIARIGSVQVPRLFEIEKYPTLFQLTSTVQAKTKASITEIFGALFPCASISGAPKVSTMNIISKLETTPRRLYTGSIGYIAPGRRAQFNVAIRTVITDRKTKSAEYGAGGGVVWDSTSEGEYDEALLKAHVLTQSPIGFSLFETILWTPQDGYFLLEKHLTRLADSANYFEFMYSHEETVALLDNLSQNFISPKRVRLELNRMGKLTSEARSFYLTQKPFRACLAEKAVDSKDVFLFHKTTQRKIYKEALNTIYRVSPNNRIKFDDVLLYNENDELTEFTIGNLVVVKNGELVTPPVSCGLLAGTFRGHLLETGRIKQQVIYKNELASCERVFLINSVRRWVEVEF